MHSSGGVKNRSDTTHEDAAGFSNCTILATENNTTVSNICFTHMLLEKEGVNE